MQTQESAEPTASTTETLTVKQVWQAFASPWWKATLAVLPIFLWTRFIFVALTYFGGILFTVPNYSPIKLTAHDIIYMWNRWDAIRFTTIAKRGYPDIENTAFFPLYPWLVQAAHNITHRDYLIVGMLISNLAFLGALIVLYRLVEMEFDSSTALRTALYLAIFPTALFFFAAYNESLFICLMLLCVYALRRSRWWFAGLFGFLATLTRSVGLFLALIFVYEFLRQKWPLIRQAWQEKKFLPLIRPLSGILAMPLIPIGLGLYSASLYVRLGHPLAFSAAQTHWRQGLSFPWVAPAQAIHGLFQYTLYTFASAHIIIDLTAFLGFLTLLLLCCFGAERFNSSQWSFVALGFLLLLFGVAFPSLPSSNNIPYDPLQAVERFVLEIFAGFILLARLGRRSWFHHGYLLIALPILAFLTLQFITQHWVV